jgi:putative FmdB family regulatory protein
MPPAPDKSLCPHQLEVNTIMPIYEYECGSCHEISEVNQKAGDPAPHRCPACGKEGGMEKIISRSSFKLVGGGFYATDYKNAPAKGLPKPGQWDDPPGAPAKKSYMDQSPEERKSTIKDITSSVANKL